jgi:hypothetical protein
MERRIQVDSLGTVLSIQEGLYISQPCLSMCTKGVTGSWDKASLYASWTGVSSGTGLVRDVVVAFGC